MAEDKISVVVAVTSGQDTSQTKGVFTNDEGDVDAAIVELPVAQLRSNLAKECQKFIDVMSDVKDDKGYKMREVEVGFEISGEGGVSFIGTAKVGARASLKLKFSRG
jgi:hypothetical protein